MKSASVAEFRARRAARDRFERSTLRDFVVAVRTGDKELFVRTMEALDRCICIGWHQGMRAVPDTPAPKDFRSWLLELWVRSGDYIRSEVDDDRVLMDALWSLLPRYSGGKPITLYRGDSLWNRRRRTYGISWTDDLEVARAFACGLWRTSEGGSVLLRTIAPAKAIICAPALRDGDRHAEREYLLDRRRLGRVEVIEGFAQVAP